jgi:dTDP-4-amino-4,6-dideoxygalactose transaminase
MGIPFNKPYQTGEELSNIAEAGNSGQLSGNGLFTGRCNKFFKEKFGFKNCFLTTSCTDALEMAAILIAIKPGDEVIVPSFTFVSTALAFNREGAKIVFADSRSDHPGIYEEQVESLITPKTRAIVVVHYAGVACDMDLIMSIADKYNLFVIEDAAHAINSYFRTKPLGSIGHLGCFSFHETKNIHCGEGGMLVINDERFVERAEVIWNKGTNRSAFSKGFVNHYEWIDTGSSFLPSELNAAFLFAQLNNIEMIEERRRIIWDYYNDNLKELADNMAVRLPSIPDYATNNGSIFYLICRSEKERHQLIVHLLNNEIQCVSHYRCLHESKYIQEMKIQHPLELVNAKNYEGRLLRLPIYFTLSREDQDMIIESILNFYKKI